MASSLLGREFESVRLTTSGAAIHLEHGGSGPPLLLLHGYPQTHVMWHRIAAPLAEHFQVICPDLRGYGDSAKPDSTADHAPYSKRSMACDMIEVMDQLGHQAFFLAGHDRGARVAHRLILDHPERVERAGVLDIVPTRHVFEHVDRPMATAYYHWFFLSQGGGLPEHLIGADPPFYLRHKLGQWSAPGAVFDPAAVAEYQRCFSDPATIHASCEDYRAAAGIDLGHDEADRGRRIACPLLALWGAKGFVGRHYDVLAVWRDYAAHVQGRALDCGHFVAEEAPEDTLAELLTFFREAG